MLTKRFGLSIFATLLAIALMLSTQIAAANEPVCGTSSPASNNYSTTVCVVAPAPGAEITGDQAISATVSTTGNRTVDQMIFGWDDEYLLTDFEAPYTFVLPSDRWADGAKTLTARATMSDGFTTEAVTVPITLVNGVETPAPNTNVFTPRGVEGSDGGLVIGAVGDGAFGSANAAQVVDLIDSWDPDMFLYLGDVYELGSIAEFHNWYGDTDLWGQFRSITNPTPGNHEYETLDATPYFYYWDNVPHYYSFDAGGWHFISLDSNSEYGGTSTSSAQYQWLQSDLAANQEACTVAFFHHPRYRPTPSGGTGSMQAIWNLLAANNVEIALTGHDHNYQRWTPLDGSGNPSETGVTQFVVGTGGEEISSFASPDSRIEVGVDSFPGAYGAMKMVVTPGSLKYFYESSAGETLDSGAFSCGEVPEIPDTEGPSAPTLTAAPNGATSAQLSWTPSTDNVGVTAYDVYRDEVLITSLIDETSYEDTGLSPGSYDYLVKARDAAGNDSEASNTQTVVIPDPPPPPVPPIFEDDFESGDLSMWTLADGLAVQDKVAYRGTFSARGKSKAQPAYATKVLGSGHKDLYYRFRFKLIGKSSDVVYLSRFRAMNKTVIGGLLLNRKNRIGWHNGSLSKTTSAVQVSKGTWHEIKAHLVVDGTSSLTEVSLDGSPLPKLTRTESLGEKAVRRLQIGESEPRPGRTFDIAFDNVVLSSQP